MSSFEFVKDSFSVFSHYELPIRYHFLLSMTQPNAIHTEIRLFPEKAINMKCKSTFSDREIIISLIVVEASTLNAFQIIRIKTFSVLEYISSHIVAIKMGKGNGNGVCLGHCIFKYLTSLMLLIDS